MSVRKLRLLSIVFAAIVLTADLAWPLGFRLSDTKEQLKLKYDVSVQDHGTGRVTVNVTIVDQGRLTPLKSAALSIPSEDRTDRHDKTPLAIKTVDGNLLVSVELQKEVAERAEIYLEPSTLDGKKLSQMWYFHAIPIAKYVKNGERKLAVDPQTAPTQSPSSAPTNPSEDGDRKRPQDPQPSRTLAVEGERQEVPFPNVDESVIDPEISALVVERIAKTSGRNQDLNRTNEIDQIIVAKGTNAVSTLIAMAQKGANTDPLVLGKSQDFGNELQCPVDMLVAIGDRRAIPLFSALMKFDTKPRRMFTSLARLLCHGTDKQIELDAKSRDPNLARVAETILRRPEQYKYYKDLYRKK